MAIPQFEEFVLDVKSFEGKYFNTKDVYTAYVFWLIGKDIGRVLGQKFYQAPVNELLFQLQIISAYVEHTLKEAENLNKNTIALKPMPAIIKKDTKKYPEVDAALLVHFRASDNAASHADDITRTLFERSIVNKVLGTFVTITAVLIGVAFAPELATAGAITLWTLGAIFGALTLAAAKLRWIFAVHDKAGNIPDDSLETMRHRLDSAIGLYAHPKDDSKTINEDSTIIKTSAIISNKIAAKTSTQSAILATVHAATETRFALVYRYPEVTLEKVSHELCAEQLVDLNKLYSRLAL